MMKQLRIFFFIANNAYVHCAALSCLYIIERALKRNKKKCEYNLAHAEITIIFHYFFLSFFLTKNSINILTILKVSHE